MSDVSARRGRAGALLLDFDEAELIAAERPEAGAAVLRVGGQAPCMNMQVRVVPVRYLQPDYWVVHVIVDLQGGACLPVMRTYNEVLAPPHPAANCGVGSR